MHLNRLNKEWGKHYNFPSSLECGHFQWMCCFMILKIDVTLLEVTFL